MTKKILVTVAIVMTTVGIAVSFDSLRRVTRFLVDDPVWIGIVLLAVTVQLVGHVFRARRTKLLIDQAAPSSTTFQFAALSTGYLFNALLPLRIGEVIRSFLIARRLRISLLYTLTAIVIERATDVVFISVLVIIGALVIGGTLAPAFALLASVSAAIGIVILMVFILLTRENKTLLAMTSEVSNVFNTVLGNSLKFKVWSLIFGLQSFFENRRLVSDYILYALASWVCYFLSAAIIVVPLIGTHDILTLVVGAISPYVVSAPSISPLDVSSYYALGAGLPSLNQAQIGTYAELIWAVLVLPMAILGIIALVLYRISPASRRDYHPMTYQNKLLRFEDISQSFPAFLDTYFRGNSLSRVLHKIEVQGGLSLVRFFKGGSDAITVLALKNGKLFVKKIVPAEYADRLRVQYLWLRRFKSKKAIVNVLDEQTAVDYYAIDLEYDPLNVSLFEYVHTRSLGESKRIVASVWEYMFKNVYRLKDEAFDGLSRDKYVEDRLMDKMMKAMAVNDDLRGIEDVSRINVNGQSYDNFPVIMEKIRQHEQAWHDLGTYRKSAVTHGDLTVDNILVDSKTDQPVIIDPSDDNQVRGPVVDLARFTQSLLAGYEFLTNDEEPVKVTEKNGIVSINYHDRRSARYHDLYRYFSEELEPGLFTDAERRTTLFHTGLLYGRMLAHRVNINPHNTLKYYGVCVVLLNEFYRQYE